MASGPASTTGERLRWLACLSFVLAHYACCVVRNSLNRLTPASSPLPHPPCSNFCHRGLVVECPEDFVCKGASPYPCVQRCPCDGALRCCACCACCAMQRTRNFSPSTHSVLPRIAT